MLFAEEDKAQVSAGELSEGVKGGGCDGWQIRLGFLIASVVTAGNCEDAGKEEW